jgi:hypothetical protein
MARRRPLRANTTNNPPRVTDNNRRRLNSTVLLLLPTNPTVRHLPSRTGPRHLPNHTAHSRDTGNHPLNSHMGNRRRSTELMARPRPGRPRNNTAHSKDMGNHRLSSRTGNSLMDSRRRSNIRRTGSSNSHQPLRRPDTAPHRSLPSMATPTHTA